MNGLAQLAPHAINESERNPLPHRVDTVHVLYPIDFKFDTVVNRPGSYQAGRGQPPSQAGGLNMHAARTPRP